MCGGSSRNPSAMKDFSHTAVDELLAAEMSRLSLREKYQLDLDIQGKNMLAAIEPPQLSSMGLQALEAELQTLKDTKFYDLALSLNSKMVASREFKLRFARAEMFDPTKAAIRLEKYLQIIYENFGQQGLLRPILLLDLDKAERDLLKAGTTQILPCRDRAGRRIIARLASLGTKHSMKQKVRVSLYTLQALSDDEETQKQGAVCLYWPQQSDVSKDSNGPLKNALRYCPIRFSAFHFCFSEEQRLSAICVRTVLLAVPEIRAHSRIHVGSVTECQYHLMTYSIPSEYIPITNTGNIKAQNHHKWLTYLEAKETASQESVAFDGIECPSVKDILAGKGPHVSNHPGNIAFRKIMESRFQEHRDATAIDRKTAITWEVVIECQRRGARFLVKDKNWWVVADQDTAREKVSIAFRDMRKSFAAKSKANPKKRIDSENELHTMYSKKRKSSNVEER
ncbi:hypothetical protein IV203_017185 [Nitzschia inconspicua]|uniref:DUF6824 domain-containing protein n=1 Tax=Nitzschia inconspicua TaxID=303405 RepID=A0A9K3KSM6_9STRA|nr:hypothetical protein IV203_017185 [Nitzschia inconspicua]